MSNPKDKGWIGVDLDGTLAHYDGWKGIEHIGEPIPKMLMRVTGWLVEGKDVRIFTARVCGSVARPRDLSATVGYIQDWCLKHIGRVLPITATKDFGLIELWDDRAVQVIPNTGERVDEQIRFYQGGKELWDDRAVQVIPNTGERADEARRRGTTPLILGKTFFPNGGGK